MLTASGLSFLRSLGHDVVRVEELPMPTAAAGADRGGGHSGWAPHPHPGSGLFRTCVPLRENRSLGDLAAAVLVSTERVNTVLQEVLPGLEKVPAGCPVGGATDTRHTAR